MLDIDAVEQEADINYQEADVWISWFLPHPRNGRLARWGSRVTGAGILHERFYVSVNFREQPPLVFYSQERPERVPVKPKSTQRRIAYIDSVRLDGTIDEGLKQWLRQVCDDRGADPSFLFEKIRNGPLEDASSHPARSDTGFVLASRVKQMVHP